MATYAQKLALQRWRATHPWQSDPLITRWCASASAYRSGRVLIERHTWVPGHVPGPCILMANYDDVTGLKTSRALHMIYLACIDEVVELTGVRPPTP